MQQIYRQSDRQFEVYTTVFSPQVCRSRARARHHVDAQKVAVAVTQYQARWPKELDLNHGDLIQVLFKEDETWWFGRLTNGSEGYFPSACVVPLQDRDRATPTLVRRGSVPVVVTAAGAPCGCTSGRSTPRLLRRDSVRRPPVLDGSTGASAPSHNSPSLLHRVLAKSRRKSCPQLPHTPRDNGSVNAGFQPD